MTFTETNAHRWRRKDAKALAESIALSEREVAKKKEAETNALHLANDQACSARILAGSPSRNDGSSDDYEHVSSSGYTVFEKYYHPAGHAKGKGKAPR